MRALIQRVKQAAVTVEGKSVAHIDGGLLIFLGISKSDDEEILPLFWRKIYNLRIFEDEDGKTNLSLADVGGSVLIVSQFTLYANCRKGNRPSFVEAAAGAEAEAFYEKFLTLARQDLKQVEQGVFGADMKVSLLNDGPFTIFLDSEEIFPNLKRGI